MSNLSIVSWLGLLSGLTGSILLALSMNKVLVSIEAILNALSLSIETFASNKDVYVFRGLEKVFEKGKKHNRWMTSIGIMLVFVSVVLQGVAINLSK